MNGKLMGGLAILLAAWCHASFAVEDEGLAARELAKAKAASMTNGSDAARDTEILVTANRVEEGTPENGYRCERGNLGPMGNVPLKDAPYSISVIPGALIENRVVHNPIEALKTAPTVVPLMSPNGYSSMNRVMVRGFTAADQSDLRDGMTDRSFTLQPVEDIERIEVLNGLSSFLYGFASVGGIVNYISKRPLAEPRIDLSAGVYNSGILFGQADLGGPVYTDRLISRLNIYGEHGDNYIKNSSQSRELVSGAVRLRLVEETYLKAAFYQQYLEQKGLQTYFDIRGIGYTVPDAFDPTRQYGQSWTYNNASKAVFDIGLDSKLNDVFTLRAAGRYGEMWRDYDFVGARLTDTAGNYTETYVGTPKQDETTTAAYALMDADFDTWRFNHKLTFGYTHWGFTFERGANKVVPLGPSSVNEPVSYSRPAGAGGQDRRMCTQTHNFPIGDRIEFSPQWSVLAGVNYAILNTYYHGAYVTPPAPDHISQDALTPAAGVVFKPADGISLYTSYMQGLEQGGTAPSSATNAYAVLDPSVSDQYEAGLKTTVLEKLDLSAALFRINKVNQYVDPADNTYKQAGREAHQGVEFTGAGKLLEKLTVVGGLTLMSAKITKNAVTPAQEDETPVNVPEQQFRLYLEYELPKLPGIPGLFTVMGGANYYGRRPVNIPNTSYIPDTTTFDAGLRYQPTAKLTFVLNMSNLLDEYYWSYYRQGSDGLGEDGLLLGDPRLIAFSGRYIF